MFRYYALSDVCYVYLHDVSGACFIGKEDCRLDQEFGTSKWHTRGWTLQELIAPTSIRFMSQDWTLIGTKGELAESLEQIAKTPASVLRFEKDVVDI